MINYMKSEFYRILREKMLYVFMAVLIGFMIFYCSVIYYMRQTEAGFPYGDTEFIFLQCTSMFVFVFFLVFLIVNVVFGNGYGNGTLKNTIGFGVSRKVVYFGKILVEVLISAIFLIIGVLVVIGLAYLTHEDSGIAYLYQFMRAILGAIPLWMVGLVTYHCLAFRYEKTLTIIAGFSYIHIITILVIKILSLIWNDISLLLKIIPIEIFNDYSWKLDENGFDHMAFVWDTNMGMLRCYIVGIILTIGFIYLGWNMFLRKEIN